MADSTSNLDNITTSQANKEVTANDMFDALSPASLYGRRASTTSGLTWGYYGGKINIAGTVTSISNGTVALSASTTNYVEADPNAGAVSKNTTAFTAGRIPLYTVVTGGSSVSSYTDHRIAPSSEGDTAAAISYSSDANKTLSVIEARSPVLKVSGTIGAQRNLVLPLVRRMWFIYNGTSGGFGIQAIGASGTGVVIANAKAAAVFCDGTNFIRLTADA